jgi:hypothetical protein
MRHHSVSETGGLASTNTSTTPIVRNTDRLRTYLTKDGLAAALLSAWQQGESGGGKAGLVDALNEFFNPKQSSDDAAANQPD